MKRTLLILQLLLILHFSNATQKVVNCETAGQLNTYFTLLTNVERYDITKLTVTGKINAEDIRFINVSLSADTLILTNADIEAYTGAPLFQSEMPVSYPENEFPAYGFKDNPNLVMILLPNSIVSIGERAFEGSALKNLFTIPYKVVTIKKNAFSGCSDVTNFSFPNSLKTIESGAFSGCTKAGTFVFPDNLESIGSYAFYGCEALHTFNFPVNLKTVGDYAFSNCSAYTAALNLHDNIHYGEGVFSGCRGLTSVTLNAPMDTIPGSFFSGCTNLTNVVLPSSIKVISNLVFENCNSLSNIDLAGINSIGDFAFSGCSGLTSVNLSNSLTNMGTNAFQGAGLLSIELPTSLSGIPASAFDVCSELKSVYLPDNIESISANAFRNCIKLETIFSKRIVPPVAHATSFSNVNKNTCMVYVPQDAIYDYETAMVWRDFYKIYKDDVLDNTAPELLFSYPANGQQDVSVTPGLQFKFDEKVALKSTFEITVEGGSQTFTYNKNNIVLTESKVIYIESAKLKYNTDYTLTIKDGSIRDLAGNDYPAQTIVFKTLEGNTKKTIALDFNRHKLQYNDASHPVDSMYLWNNYESLGYKFVGDCNSGGNKSYDLRGRFQYTERNYPIFIESVYNICTYTDPGFYTRSHVVGSDTSLVLANEGSYNLTAQNAKVKIDMTKMSALTPITDVYVKIRLNMKSSEITEKPLVVSVYSAGIEKQKLNMFNSTYHKNGVDYPEFAFIHLALNDVGKIDSLVILKNDVVFAEIQQVKFDYLLDKQLPSLTSSYPSNGALGVSQTPGITLKFSENVRLKQDGNLFVKIIEQGKTNATFAYSYLERVNTDSTTVCFESKMETYFDSNPDTLKTNTQYKLIIPAGMIIDNSGNAFNVSDYEITFTTGSKNIFHTLFYPAGDLKYLGGKFLGGTTGEACGATANRYHLQTSFFKREFMENDIKINLYSKSTVCYYDFIKTIPEYKGSKYFLEFNERFENGVYMDADEKATFELAKFKDSNNPVTDLIIKIKHNGNGLNLTSYSNGSINNSIYLKSTSHDGLDYRYIHLPVINNVQIDSLVVSGIGVSVYGLFIQHKQTEKPVVNLGSNRDFCQNDVVVLDAGFNPQSTYLWNNGSKTQTIEVKNSGTYSVAVTNRIGTTNAQVTLTAKTKPTAIYNKQTIVKCAGENVTLTANDNASFTYQWSASYSPLFHSNERSLQVVVPGMYSVKISNGGCDIIDTVYVEDRQGARVAFMNQSCCFGYSDLRGELYVKNQQGSIFLFKVAEAPGGGSTFDSIPAGNYIYKSHVNQLTMLNDNNPWVDTYHNGKTNWTKVIPFKLNCTTDTTIAFEMSKMFLDFDFNGTGLISGTIQVVNGQSNAPRNKIKAQLNDACETKVMLYDGNGNLIASTCPDGNGNYSFTNLPVGDYTVGIERTGFEVESVFTTTVEEGESVINANFTVNENTQIVEQGLSTGNKSINASTFSFEVYPNPMKENAVMSIELPSDSETLITMVDITGKIVFTQISQLYKGKNTIAFNAKNLKGLYLIKISAADGMSTKRLLVE